MGVIGGGVSVWTDVLQLVVGHALKGGTILGKKRTH